MENSQGKLTGYSLAVLFIKRLCGDFQRLWEQLIGLCRASLYCRLFERVMDFLSSACTSSRLYKIFTAYNGEDGWLQKSWAYKLPSAAYARFDAALVKCGGALRSFAQGSVLIGAAAYMRKNLFKISVRYYGAAMVVFGLFKAVYDVLVYMQMPKNQLFEACMAAAGIIFIIINRSPAALYNGSRLRELAGLPECPDDIACPDGDKATAVSITTGTALWLVTLLPMWKYILLGAAGALAVIVEPAVGGFVALVLFPFMPTMALVGVVMLSLVGLLISRAAGLRERFKLNIYEFCIILVCSSFIYGVLNSFAPKSSLKIALVYIVFALSFSLIRRIAHSRGRLFFLIDMLLLALAAVCAYGLYQKFSGSLEDTTWLDPTMFGDLGGRMYSTFANPNVFGEYLLLTIPLCLARITYSKRLSERVFYGGILAAALVCMAYTMSRGCWMGIIAAVLIFMVFQARGAIPFAVVGAFFMPLLLPDKIINRFMSIGNMADSSTSYRVYIWEGTIRMLKDFWYTGVGLGTDAYNALYPIYAYSSIVAPHPHSLYLLILSETGLLGVIVTALLLFIFFRRLSAAALAGGSYKTLAVGLGAGMAGFLLQGFFDNVWYNYRLFLFFFMYLALADVLARLAARDAKGGEQSGKD